MNDIIMSWPWYDRMIAGIAVVSIAFGPYYIAKQLGDIANLLREIRDKLPKK